MSENILKALLQLFAIIVKTERDAVGANGHKVVERFLMRQFTAQAAAQHMSVFEAYVAAFHSSGGDSQRGRKRTSVNSVKVLKICTEVNEELNQHQKFTVLIHLLELVHARGELLDQERDFVATVAETFNIAQSEFQRCEAFVSAKAGDREDVQDLLYIDAANGPKHIGNKHIHAHGLSGEVRVLNIPSVSIYLMRYLGNGELLLSGQQVDPERVYLLGNGISLRPPGGLPVYYSDMLASFQSDRSKDRIEFRADGIEYCYPNGRIGLHEMHLAETSGKLIGIMGGSGSGKSTLLNVLNGNLKPSKGTVTINGIDVHADADRIRGVVGHISQDDLLIEELTVFQNLYFNARLCFGDLSKTEIAKRVLALLQSLGLYDTKDLKVGTPLDKTISGGQRKRLNIALELIREPSVLFVDEPTSGLSSRDSENIMDLLKELALKGRIIFTVIHQPSSEIFKLFDRLLLMDQEGNPVYYGDPVDAVVYFKKVTGQADSEVGQCEACGNVNPEQIFNIIEAKIVDEYGNETDQRRIGPEAWNEVFRAQMENRVAKVPDEHSIPKSTFNAPNKLRQMAVFFRRDVVAKLVNRQYVLINLIEAPALALVMAFFLRYTGAGLEGSNDYVYRQNDNIPQYLFISVIVALFMGLTVAAEEIIRDRRILQREKFLSLSRASYLLSKISVLFIISAVQSLLFTQVGDHVLGLSGLGFQHWAVLFSLSCFANVLGLNVSASFNSAKVIYIMIPVLIIPQLLFSGIIVRFDKLHPWFASEKSVPWIGNIMASRWAYEGLAVSQFCDNGYEKLFYDFDRRMKTSNWKKDLWVRELKERSNDVKAFLDGRKTDTKEVESDLALITRELEKEMLNLRGFNFPNIGKLQPGKVDKDVITEVETALEMLSQHYRNTYKQAEREKEARIAAMTATPELRKDYFALLDDQRNESLSDFVTNKNDVNVITLSNGELVQKSDPVYVRPVDGGFFSAQFYAPAKRFFGLLIPTLWANVMLLWGMTLALAFALKMDLMPKSIALMERAFSKRPT
ncbi:MAG: ATP-binding cassette domain-containing protein [Flavobacteriales bacterium]|nr:ATP-binding cassette domain-containing protein [Flavobacteriales bacterium]